MEVSGYKSSPISYTIIIVNEKAYVVEDGQVTTEEAINLDFLFKPVFPPTDD
jgi:hypothetical protein